MWAVTCINCTIQWLWRDADFEWKTWLSLTRHPTPEVTRIVIDGCALLWISQWPLSTSTQNQKLCILWRSPSIISMSSSIRNLIFDRYEDFSTKSSSKASRMAEGYKTCYLTSTLPSQKVTLAITQNKKLLIVIICKYLWSNTYF